MTAGLFQTQIQNKFRFKSLFSKTPLFIHNPIWIQLLSLSSTRGMTNCIGTEGVKFTLINRTWHKVCQQCFKGELDIKHAISEIFKMKQMLWEVTICIFKMTLTATGYWLLLRNCAGSQMWSKTYGYFHWQIIAMWGWRVQTVTV